ncbi:MAG TPA: RecT family recombinase [Chlamydiales bacterium]|nr:RecT family recombinase [Chlamydiales bacterium]
MHKEIYKICGKTRNYRLANDELLWRKDMRIYQVLGRFHSFSKNITSIRDPLCLKTSALVGPILFSSSRGVFTALQKEQSGFVDRITGFEENPEKRKSMTDQLKTLGFMWSGDSKSWVPRKEVQMSTVEAILKGSSESVAPAREAISTAASYPKRIDGLLTKWSDSIGKVLPRQIRKDKFMESLRIALINAERAGNVSSDEALRTACMRCAEIGLVPGPLQECYFSTRDNQIEFLLGYKGIIALARRTSPHIQIETQVVRKGDDFSFSLGTKPKVSLNQSIDANPEEIEYAYVLIRFPEGVEKLVVIDKAHVEKRKACSKGVHATSSPWNKFQREMWLKTALREAFRFVNLSTETNISQDFDHAKQSIREFIHYLQDEVEDFEKKEIGKTETSI